MEKNSGFAVAFVLFSLAILTVMGLNLSAGELSVSDHPDAVLALEQGEEGVTLTVFDNSYLLPRSLLARLEEGRHRLQRTAALLLPARFQTLMGACALLRLPTFAPEGGAASPFSLP